MLGTLPGLTGGTDQMTHHTDHTGCVFFGAPGPIRWCAVGLAIDRQIESSTEESLGGIVRLFYVQIPLKIPEFYPGLKTLGR